MNDPHPNFSGIYYGLAAAEYHAVEALSSSGVKKLLKSPSHYRFERDHPSEPTAAMTLGTAIHSIVLEQQESAQRIAVLPPLNRRTKDGRAELDAFITANKGKLLLSQEEFDRAIRCAAAVMEHPAAAQLLDGGERELSLFWTDGRYSVPCKARFDCRNRGLIVDLKTCQSAAPDDFSRSIATFGYDVQAAHYFSGAEHVLNETPEGFVFIAAETEEPFAVACYVLGRQSIHVGMNKCDEALKRYQIALQTGEWPGYAAEITEINMPRYALKEVYA